MGGQPHFSGHFVVQLLRQRALLIQSAGRQVHRQAVEAGKEHGCHRSLSRLSCEAVACTPQSCAFFSFANQVPADKFLFQWRWKLKVYSVVDERRADEIIRARAVAGDQQSAFIPIFLDCPDFTTDERFDFTEDALRDALKFIDIAATISAVTLTTYSQCRSSPGALTWATVPRYNNAGLYGPRSCSVRCVA